MHFERIIVVGLFEFYHFREFSDDIRIVINGIDNSPIHIIGETEEFHFENFGLMKEREIHDNHKNYYCGYIH